MKFSKGIRYILIATFVFAIMNVLVKKIPHIPPVEIVLFRSVISLVICLVSLYIKKVPVWGKNKKILIARGAFGAMALVFFFTTLQNIPIASATILHYIAPIFTTLIAAIFLREQVKAIQYLFFAVSFIGIFFIKSFDPQISLLYLFLGVGSAFFSGCAYNCIRKLNTTEHPLVIVFYFPLVTIPIVGSFSAFYWVMPQNADWLYLIAIGILTQIAQVLMTKAYQREEASHIAGASYIGVIYALALGFVFFDEVFSWQVVIGMVLVTLGVLLNLTYKNLIMSSRKKPVG